MDMTFDADGFAELEKQLKQLDIVAQKRTLRKAARESAKPIESKMRSNVSSQGHIDTGLLEDSIKTRTSIPKNSTWADVIAAVGIYRNSAQQKAAGRKIDPPVYAWWLEFGVQPHATGRSAKRSRSTRQGSGIMHPGFAAKPFIRPAFDNLVEQSLQIQKTVLAKQIEKALS